MQLIHNYAFTVYKNNTHGEVCEPSFDLNFVTLLLVDLDVSCMTERSAMELHRVVVVVGRAGMNAMGWESDSFERSSSLQSTRLVGNHTKS